MSYLLGEPGLKKCKQALITPCKVFSARDLADLAEIKNRY